MSGRCLRRNASFACCLVLSHHAVLNQNAQALALMEWPSVALLLEKPLCLGACLSMRVKAVPVPYKLRGSAFSRLVHKLYQIERQNQRQADLYFDTLARIQDADLSVKVCSHTAKNFRRAVRQPASTMKRVLSSAHQYRHHFAADHP